jgi:hypothetical protein
MRALLFSLLMMILILPSAEARASAEVTLFDSGGDAVAYIAPAEDMTIYLWDGTPVAISNYKRATDTCMVSMENILAGWFPG